MGSIVIRKKFEENFIHSGYRSIRISSSVEDVVEYEGDLSGDMAKRAIKKASDRLYKIARALTKRDLIDVEEQVRRLNAKGGDDAPKE